MRNILWRFSRMDINEILRKMTLEEKAALVSGTDFMYTNPIPRLGLKSVRMSDGPHGLRVQTEAGDNGVSQSEPATCFPTAVTLASTFNTAYVRAVGEAIGREAEHYGVDVLLGPGVNIKRNPLAGRNFEYYSEDPHLAGKLGAAFVMGVQSRGVDVAVKHFALNNSENFRFMGDSVCDERAAREIYLKPFEIVVKEANPGTVMSSYNKVNGTYASENRWLLTDVLRGEWGFGGAVMTDWGGTHDRIEMLKSGLDIEMPGDTDICRKWICDAVKDGTLDESVLDTAVKNILTLAAKHEGRVKKNVKFELNRHLAEKVATDGAVLMKNDGILPLRADGEYMVVGELFEKPRYQGSGSSMINPTALVTPKDAFDSRKIKYEYAKGYRENKPEPDAQLMDEAVAKAEKFDTVLAFIGLTDYVESEGCDRENMYLPENQLALIDALIKSGKRVCIVTYGGAPYEMPFADDVAAILNMYLPGQECGGSTAALLFGELSPSGRLAETWPISYSDVPFGDSFGKSQVEVYRESVFVGYRYYTTANKKVRFPFGHGLSYTTFEYSDMSVKQDGEGVTVGVTVKNTGKRIGGEVVQLYVAAPISDIYKPSRELRAFDKVYLKPDEATRVELFVPYEALRYWDIKKKRYVLEDGDYTFMISKNACDVILSREVNIDGECEDSPYTDKVGTAYSLLAFKAIDDALFEEMSSLKIPALPPKKPIVMESRFTDLKETFVGKILYSAVLSVARKDMKAAKKLPEGKDRDNKIKGAIFMERILDSNSLTTMSMAAGKQFPYNFAEGFMHLANGKIFKGAKCFLTKIKAPALPKEKENE